MGPGGDPSVPGHARRLRLGAIARSLGAGPLSAEKKLARAYRIEVPDVEGLTEEQARQKLTASDFELDVRKQESSATEASKVLDQSPVVGRR